MSNVFSLARDCDSQVADAGFKSGARGPYLSSIRPVDGKAHLRCLSEDEMRHVAQCDVGEEECSWCMWIVHGRQWQQKFPWLCARRDKTSADADSVKMYCTHCHGGSVKSCFGSLLGQFCKTKINSMQIGNQTSGS